MHFWAWAFIDRSPASPPSALLNEGPIRASNRSPVGFLLDFVARRHSSNTSPVYQKIDRLTTTPRCQYSKVLFLKCYKFQFLVWIDATRNTSGDQRWPIGSCQVHQHRAQSPGW